MVGPEETNPWGLYTGLVRLSISAIEGLVRLSFSAQQLGAHALKGRRAAVLLREGFVWNAIANKLRSAFGG